MLGVVLWSDASDRKAVIWCEDQGDLAFVSGSDEVLSQEDFFDAGDLVQFDMHIRDAKRRARNTRLVMEKASTALPEVLRDEVLQKAANETASASILPFFRATASPVSEPAEQIIVCQVKNG